MKGGLAGPWPSEGGRADGCVVCMYFYAYTYPVCLSRFVVCALPICCTPSCLAVLAVRYLKLASSWTLTSHQKPKPHSLSYCSLYDPQPMEVYIDDETKLTLHGLQQHYVKLQDKEKNRKLFDLLDVLEFNQVGV